MPRSSKPSGDASWRRRVTGPAAAVNAYAAAVMNIRRLSVPSLTLLLVTIIGGSPAAAWSRVQYVVVSRTNAPSHSVALDGAGRSHIAFASIHQMPGLWYQIDRREPVRVTGTGARFDLEVGIALHTSGSTVTPRIVWADEDDRKALWLSDRDSGSWTSRRIWIGRAFDPVVTPRGRGVAVTFTDGKGRLRYLTWDPISGATKPVTIATGCCTGPPAMGVRDGTVWVAFAESRSGTDRLRVAKRQSNGTWAITTVDATNSADPSLAFRGSSSFPTIAYRARGKGVRVASRSGGAWRWRKVAGSAYGDPSIAADAAGRTVIATVSATRVAFRRIDSASASLTVVARAEQDTSNPLVESPTIGLYEGRATIHFGAGGEGGSPAGLFRVKQ